MPRNILFLCHRVPYPPDKGDRIRSYRILRLLAEMGDVSLGYLVGEPVPATTVDWLNQHCRQVVAEPLPRLKRWLRGTMNMLRGRSATDGLFYSPEFARRIDARRVKPISTSSFVFPRRWCNTHCVPGWNSGRLSIWSTSTVKSGGIMPHGPSLRLSLGLSLGGQPRP